MQPNIEILQKLLEEGVKFTFEQISDYILVVVTKTESGKDFALEIKVDKVEDFLQENPLTMLLISLKRWRKNAA